MTNSYTDRFKIFEKRTFISSIMQLLENEYKIIGSHKVIKLIAEDIDQLHLEFFPNKSTNNLGEIQWLATSIENGKSNIGKNIEDYETTIVNLPYITQDDIKLKQEGISQKELDKIRIKRITVAAKEQGGLIGTEELALILNRSRTTISKYIKEYHKESNELLPLKGYILDIGSGTTHKGIIIKLYEENIAPPDIARRTYHNLKSVDNYIKDYERVKLLVKKGLSKTEISNAINKGRRLINEYIEIIKIYHPEYFEEE